MLLIVLAALVVVGHCFWFRDFVVDDAAISFSYARNLATGHGLVLAPNFERVEGYSNFLWVLMLAAGAALRLDLFMWAHLLGALSAIATVVGSATLAASLRGRQSSMDAVPAFLVAIFLPIAYWAMSGLEGGVYTALVVWCAVALASEASDPHQQWPVSPWLAAAIALTRPDGIAIWGGAAFMFCRRSHSWSARLRWFVIASAPVIAHLLWRRYYYAFWLPNTFYAKTQSPFTASQLFDLKAPGWRYVRAFAERYRLAVLFAPATLEIVFGARQKVSRGLAILASCILVFPIYARGDWMSEGRFLVAVLPILCVLALAGAERVARGRRTPAVFMVAWLVVTAWLLVPNSVQHSIERHNNYPVPVESVAVRARLYRRLAAEYSVHRPSALDGDLGGTSFYSGMPIIDMGMLGDITFARANGDRDVLREYVYYERQPTFMMQVGFWKELGLQKAPEFADRYVPIPGPDGLFVDRRIFLETVMDSRTCLATFSDAGVDLLATNVAHEVALWLLVRKTSASALKLRSQSGFDWPVVHPVLSSKSWRPGDIVKIKMPRPEETGLRLCSESSCTSLPDGFVGPTPFIGIPSSSAFELAVSRRDWEVALRIATQRDEVTTAIAQELMSRAGREYIVGDTGRAFRDYSLALKGDPSLAMARRRIEELRHAPRARVSYELVARYEIAKRQFVLSPSPETLSRVAVFGRAAGEYDAARLHLATGIRPSDDDAALDLAELLAMSGWLQEGIAVLPPTQPQTLARVRAAAVLAWASSTMVATTNDHAGEKEIAPGLMFHGAWVRGEADANAQTQVTFAFRRGIHQHAAREIDIAGRSSAFDRSPDDWDFGEIYLHTVYLELPKGTDPEVRVNKYSVKLQPSR